MVAFTNLKSALILAAVIVGASVATHRPARTINVPGDYPTIQSAIEAAGSGDEIVVARGEYVESISFLGKSMTLRSADPTDPNVVAKTIINGDGADHVVRCVDGERPDTVLSGFTITGGNADGTGEDRTGGGLYCFRSSPTVSYCTFVDNRAFEGAGMMNLAGSPRVSGCTFSVNIAHGRGGGGIGNISSSPIVRDSVFWGNRGGGMLNRDASNPTVTRCVFASNSGETGGGMENHDSNPFVANCFFGFNSADIGGGVYSRASSLVLAGSVFLRNSAGTGGELYLVDSTASLTNCTISDNDAPFDGAIFNDASRSFLKNCILRGEGFQ